VHTSGTLFNLAVRAAGGDRQAQRSLKNAGQAISGAFAATVSSAASQAGSTAEGIAVTLENGAAETGRYAVGASEEIGGYLLDTPEGEAAGLLTKGGEVAAKGLTYGVKELLEAIGLGKEISPTKGLNYLYQKVGQGGEHLKFGITKNPATRYTPSQLGGGRLRFLKEGTRPEMLEIERFLHENLPLGPEEGQPYYQRPPPDGSK
jgi:hypothetical protein